MTTCWEKMYLMESDQREHRKGWVRESKDCRKEAPVFWRDGSEGENCRQTGGEAGPREMERPGISDPSCCRTWQ